MLWATLLHFSENNVMRQNSLWASLRQVLSSGVFCDGMSVQREADTLLYLHVHVQAEDFTNQRRIQSNLESDSSRSETRFFPFHKTQGWHARVRSFELSGLSKTSSDAPMHSSSASCFVRTMQKWEKTSRTCCPAKSLSYEVYSASLNVILMISIC